MMKSFFKKLSLVMALAMVVSMMAPAASAFAAEDGIALQGTKNVVKEYDVEIGEEVVDFCFLGAPADWKTTFKWTSDNEEVATVDQTGLVTTLKDGVATITITAGADASYVQSVVLTVGEGEVDLSAFKATQVSDSKVELTFNDKSVTKAALEAGLGFYYYIGTYKVEVPLIKSISDVKDGVTTVELYTTLKDGTVYGFTYGNAEPAEFTGEIGEVATIYFTYDNAFVGEYTTLKPVLLNANNVDITTTALSKNGAYVLFTEEKQATNGEYWVLNDTIYFSEVTVAEVLVQYFGGYDDEGNVIAGPSIALPVVSKIKPPYGIDFNGTAAYTIAQTTDWYNVNTKLAVGDNGFYLDVKTKDNNGDDVDSNNTTNGTWRFESTNVSILYVTADGLLMPNTAGPATVLVYYKPYATNVESLVAAVAVTVSPSRATANVTLDKTSAVISTMEGYNEVEFTVTLTDALGQARPANQKVTVKTTTNVATATAKPMVAGDNDGEVDVYTGADGKVKFKVVGSAANIAANSTTGVQTYNFTVTSNGITRSFAVTIKAPQYSNNNMLVSGYKLVTSGATDVKVKNNANLSLKADLTILSNGVAAGTQNILGAKPSVAANAVNNGFYYTVTKNGSDITNKSTVSGCNVEVVLCTTESKTGIASGSAIDVVKKEQGVGNYTITVYQAIAATGSSTPSSFKTVTSTTVTVTDSQDTAAYGGKLASTASANASVVDIVKSCFKFTVGSTTYDAIADYTDAYIVVNSNTVTGGNVVYVNSVDLYKKAAECDAYIKYTIAVGDYVTLQ